MAIVLLDSENADRDLTALITVLTDTPDASNPILCQAIIMLGDGSKDLDGTGGSFDLEVTVGGQTVQTNPYRLNFDAEIRSAIVTRSFPVPANKEVVIGVKSPNGADTDVDTTAYLCNLSG